METGSSRILKPGWNSNNGTPRDASSTSVSPSRNRTTATSPSRKTGRISAVQLKSKTGKTSGLSKDFVMANPKSIPASKRKKSPVRGERSLPRTKQEIVTKPPQNKSMMTVSEFLKAYRPLKRQSKETRRGVEVPKNEHVPNPGTSSKNIAPKVETEISEKKAKSAETDKKELARKINPFLSNLKGKKPVMVRHKRRSAGRAKPKITRTATPLDTQATISYANIIGEDSTMEKSEIATSNEIDSVGDDVSPRSFTSVAQIDIDRVLTVTVEASNENASMISVRTDTDSLDSPKTDSSKEKTASPSVVSLVQDTAGQLVDKAASPKTTPRVVSMAVRNTPSPVRKVLAEIVKSSVPLKNSEITEKRPTLDTSDDSGSNSKSAGTQAINNRVIQTTRIEPEVPRRVYDKVVLPLNESKVESDISSIDDNPPSLEKVELFTQEKQTDSRSRTTVEDMILGEEIEEPENAIDQSMEKEKDSLAIAEQKDNSVTEPSRNLLPEELDGIHVIGAPETTNIVEVNDEQKNIDVSSVQLKEDNFEDVPFVKTDETEVIGGPDIKNSTMEEDDKPENVNIPEIQVSHQQKDVITSLPEIQTKELNEERRSIENSASSNPWRSPAPQPESLATFEPKKAEKTNDRSSWRRRTVWRSSILKRNLKKSNSDSIFDLKRTDWNVITPEKQSVIKQELDTAKDSLDKWPQPKVSDSTKDKRSQASSTAIRNEIVDEQVAIESRLASATPSPQRHVRFCDTKDANHLVQVEEGQLENDEPRDNESTKVKDGQFQNEQHSESDSAPVEPVDSSSSFRDSSPELDLGLSMDSLTMENFTCDDTAVDDGMHSPSNLKDRQRNDQEEEMYQPDLIETIESSPEVTGTTDESVFFYEVARNGKFELLNFENPPMKEVVHEQFSNTESEAILHQLGELRRIVDHLVETKHAEDHGSMRDGPHASRMSEISREQDSEADEYFAREVDIEPSQRYSRAMDSSTSTRSLDKPIEDEGRKETEKKTSQSEATQTEVERQTSEEKKEKIAHKSRSSIFSHTSFDELEKSIKMMYPKFDSLPVPSVSAAPTPFESKEIEIVDHDGNIVEGLSSKMMDLIIGGQRFDVLVSTLLKFPHSRLGKLARKKESLGTSSMKTLYIDRNSKWFQVILEFLRTHRFPQSSYSREELNEIREEAKFYQIEEDMFSEKFKISSSKPEKAFRESSRVSNAAPARSNSQSIPPRPVTEIVQKFELRHEKTLESGEHRLEISLRSNETLKVDEIVGQGVLAVDIYNYIELASQPNDPSVSTPLTQNAIVFDSKAHLLPFSPDELSTPPIPVNLTYPGNHIYVFKLEQKQSENEAMGEIPSSRSEPANVTCTYCSLTQTLPPSDKIRICQRCHTQLPSRSSPSLSKFSYPPSSSTSSSLTIFYRIMYEFDQSSSLSSSTTSGPLPSKPQDPYWPSTRPTLPVHYTIPLASSHLPPVPSYDPYASTQAMYMPRDAFSVPDPRPRRPFQDGPAGPGLVPPPPASFVPPKPKQETGPEPVTSMKPDRKRAIVYSDLKKHQNGQGRDPRGRRPDRWTSVIRKGPFVRFAPKPRGT